MGPGARFPDDQAPMHLFNLPSLFQLSSEKRHKTCWIRDENGILGLLCGTYSLYVTLVPAMENAT